MRCCNNSEAAVLLGSCLLRSSSLRCTLRSCWKCLWLITIRRVALSLSANFLFPFFLSFFLFYLLGLVSMLSFHELSCALVFCAFRCSLWCSLVTCLVSSSKRTFRSQNGLHKHFFFLIFVVLAHFVILPSWLLFSLMKSVGSVLFLFCVYKFPLCHGCRLAETLFIFRTASVF